jgi:molybdate transport system ATP-binding protein
VFNQLSIGQQRLAYRSRFLKHPPLVILDEPLEGLDDTNTSLITQLINTLITETTMTIIYVSHRIEPSLSPQAVLEPSRGFNIELLNVSFFFVSP